jgi:uncharacterized protein YaeQ
MFNTIEITSVKIQSNGWLLNGNMSVPDAPGNKEREAILKWIAEGNTPEPDVPTQEQLTQQAKAAIYDLLDKTAQQYDYRDFAEVAQFVNSNVWKAEADGLLAWQDTVWVKTYELLKFSITSIDDFVVQLPKYIPTGGS